MLTTRLGWFGAVAYALPILEVWLLTRLSEHGASVLLLALQVLWGLALIGVVHRCIRGSHAFREANAAAARETATAIAAAPARRDAHDAAGARDRAPWARPLPLPRRPAPGAGASRPSSARRRSHR